LLNQQTEKGEDFRQGSLKGLGSQKKFLQTLYKPGRGHREISEKRRGFMGKNKGQTAGLKMRQRAKFYISRTVIMNGYVPQRRKKERGSSGGGTRAGKKKSNMGRRKGNEIFCEKKKEKASLSAKGAEPKQWGVQKIERQSGI